MYVCSCRVLGILINIYRRLIKTEYILHEISEKCMQCVLCALISVFILTFWMACKCGGTVNVKISAKMFNKASNWCLFLLKYLPRLLIGRYLRMFPSALTALDLTLSLSWQALMEVVNNFWSNRSEKSFIKSLSPSILKKKMCLKIKEHFNQKFSEVCTNIKDKHYVYRYVPVHDIHFEILS